ncbi:TPA: hypothetical protein ACX6QM_002926 [Photobacterium damselae]
MTNAFESIQQGLMEAIEFAEDKKKGATVHNFGRFRINRIKISPNIIMLFNDFLNNLEV